MKNTVLITLSLFLIFTGCAHMNSTNTSLKHLDYLIEVEGPKAIQFAKDQNKLTDERLKSDPRYNKVYEEILSIVSAKDRLPGIYLMNSRVINFWQDNVHIKGILRHTSIESFNTGKPKWETLLDIDDLAKKEQKNWVYKGILCLEPAFEKCMVTLSDGGKDAGVIREFNLTTKTFVEHGFFIPESKSHLSWIDNDTLIVGDGTDASPLTSSGYPTTVRLLKRGQSLKEASIVFSVSNQSMATYASSFVKDDERYTIVYDQKSFYESVVYFVDFEKNKLLKLQIPSTAVFETIYKSQIVFSLREDMDNFKAGSLLSFPISQIESAKLDYSVVFTPEETVFLEKVSESKNHLYLETLNDVKRQLRKYSFQNSQWSYKEINIGDVNGNESLISAEKDSSHIYLSYSDFLTPSAYYYLNDLKSDTPKKVLQSPSRFNAKNIVFKQYKVKSKDGTLVPYFLIHAKNLKYDSKNPTLIYGYGGFEIALTPSYLGSTGKAWLEKGGVYVLSNIRGGGEYGPKWHRSALRENRHKAYEDFYAIVEDLIAKKVTSPAHLGIRGGSNGGLLTSVAFTQRPELFKAVLSEVPLANMMEYHKWLAGASWMEEYGNPDDKKMHEYLLSYSPLHNLKKEKTYPEVFYLTSTKDDRVHPAHARQMVARMKELGHPVLYNENTDGGHGRATNMKELAEFLALQYTYLYQKLF